MPGTPVQIPRRLPDGGEGATRRWLLRGTTCAPLSWERTGTPTTLDELQRVADTSRQKRRPNTF
eukprot:1607727-Lingulodinium_polyedra.AAC.1